MYDLLRKLPWPARLFLLLAIAAPLVDIGLVTRWVPADPISRLEAKTAYAVALWAFIALNIGLDKFIAYVSGAAVMGVATVIFGAVVQEVLGFGGETPAEMIS